MNPRLTRALTVMGLSVLGATSPVFGHSKRSVQVAHTARAQGNAACHGEVIPAGGQALAAALASAPAAARLCLGPGVHAAGLTIERSVTLAASDPSAATTLQGDGRGPVLRVDADGILLRLEGLTLENGSADAGGGLSVRGRGVVQVEDCTFRGNRAGMAGGGGLYARSGSLSVERTRFHGNSGKQGGGVWLDQVVKADLSRCAFAENQSDRGGAMSISEGAVVDLRACSATANKAAQFAAALWVHGSKSRKPVVRLQVCDIEGALTNGPEIPGTIDAKGSTLPASWRGAVKDRGGNSWRALPPE